MNSLHPTHAHTPLWSGALMALALTACGSGGGGGGGTAGLSYTGSTSAAALTQTNSTAILVGAYQGGKPGATMGSVASLDAHPATASRPRTFTLYQALSQAVSHAQLGHPGAPAVAAAIIDLSDQAAGNCGGTMSYSGARDDVTDNFNITFTFSNYCEDGTTLAGTATASGQIDDTLNFRSLAIAFDNLTITDASDSFTTDGDLTITPGVSQTLGTTVADVAVNMLMRDNGTQLVYKVDAFNMSLTTTATYADINITSGRFYDPQQGYVDITTPAALHLQGNDEWASSGTLQATGLMSTASLTVISNTTYQIDIDANNDGTIDITSTGLWANI